MSRPPAVERLDDALAGLATTPRLLVACDYDGTLAAIVDDPAAAVPLPGAMSAMVELAALPSTVAVLLSGRQRADLAGLSGAPEGVRLVGSHGLEHDAPQPGLTAAETALLDQVRAAAAALADGIPGALLEDKPAGVSVHVRRCDTAAGDDLLARVAAGPASLPGVHALPGKRVLELSVRPLGKGAALQRLMAESRATGVLVAGDDVTDEDAFAALHHMRSVTAVTVKVGAGPTAAAHRIDGPARLPDLLRVLAARRRDAGDAQR